MSAKPSPQPSTFRQGGALIYMMGTSGVSRARRPSGPLPEGESCRLPVGQNGFPMEPVTAHSRLNGGVDKEISLAITVVERAERSRSKRKSFSNAAAEGVGTTIPYLAKEKPNAYPPWKAEKKKTERRK